MSNLPAEETVQAWIELHRTHRQLLERVEKALKDSKLPPLDWYDVLLELHRVKDLGLRQYEIGEKILLNKHNLSRLIDRLQNKQLVGRHDCAEDGRGNRIKITAQGEKVLQQVWPIYANSMQENFGARLDTDELTELARLLGKLRLSNPET